MFVLTMLVIYAMHMAVVVCLASAFPEPLQSGGEVGRSVNFNKMVDLSVNPPDFAYTLT